MYNWIYDVATQTIAGGISGLVVGGVLLYSQQRMEKRMERERRLLDSQLKLLGAAIQMHESVSRTHAGTGNAEHVATGWSESQRAATDWAAIEASSDLPNDVVKTSQKAREALQLDLVAIMGMSPIGGDREKSTEQRARWLSIPKRERLDLLQELIAACKRTRP